ncbi:DUF397 domain-containing protein [Streptomyces sp. NPDC004610]|uniref:DUF397 domain-containing protein n=1 Tax=unclassified Streptomyces TaxID=2593676 RepID=UPI0033AAC6F9
MRNSELRAWDTAHAVWRRSSYSLVHGDCVEVAQLPGIAVAIRDSKDPRLTPLRFSEVGWSAFRGGIEAGALRG